MSVSLRRSASILFVACALGPTRDASAADNVATLNFNNRTWSNPTAWVHSNPAFNGTVPNNSALGTYDIVVQRTVDLDLDVTVEKGTLDGGQISDAAASPNTLRFNGLFNFRNGFLQPNTTAAGGILFDNPTGNPFIERGVLTLPNLGVATWTGGDITTLSGGRLDVAAGARLVANNPNDDDAFFVDIESVFDLRGLLEKVGPHDITFTRNFLNNGNVTIAQGGVRTAGAGQTSGRWFIDALANWTITSGTHVMHDGARVGGDGVLNVLQAARLQIGGTGAPVAHVEVNTLNLERGGLELDRILTVLRHFGADRAVIQGPGTVLIAPGATFDIDLRNGPMSITQTVVECEGTTTITGGGSNSLALQNAPRLYLLPDGQMRLTAPATLASTTGVPGSILNEGTTRVITTPQGNLITLLNVDFVNRGNVVLPLGSGMRILDADFSQQSGETTIERDATLEIVNGLMKLGGGTTNLAGTIDGLVKLFPELGGNVYVNIHSAVFPGGEIRGQLDFRRNDALGGEAFLAFNIGGRSAGQDYDRLIVTESAALGGNLVVDLVNGFENSILQGDVFTILDAASITDAFDNVVNGGRLADEDGLGTFRVNYGLGSPFDPTDVVLSDFVFIPEPGTGVVMCIAGVMLTRRRR